MTNQKGWTLSELIAGLAVLVSFALLVFLVYALVHFITKYW